MRRPRAIVVLLFLAVSAANGAETPSSARINDDVATRISNGVSFAPVLGYDPTYAFLLGGAAFRSDNHLPGGSNGSLILYGSTKNAFAVEFKFVQWFPQQMFWDLDASANNFFTAYYGEGDTNVPADEKKLDNLRVNVIPGLWYRFTRQITAGFFSEIRYRRETAVDGNPAVTLFPTEFNTWPRSLWRIRRFPRGKVSPVGEAQSARR